MNKIKNLIGFVVFVILLSFLGCAGTTSSGIKNAQTEIWQLELMGQTRGSLKMTLQRIETQKGIYSVSAKIVGKIEDHLGGRGNSTYTLKGTIKNSVFNASLSGHSEMTAGPSSVTGAIQGNLFDLEGSGTWNMRHDLGDSTGNYTMKKMISN